jgi:DNA-binding transcriptional regulator YiaG
MGKMEDALKAEMLRLTRKQLRQNVDPLAKEVKELRKAVAKLEKLLDSQEKAPNDEAKQLPHEALSQVSDDEIKTARLSSRAIKNIRKKLGISQEKLAAVLDVSPGAVAFWEQGRARPRGENKAALVALRKLGRRNMKRILAEKGIST